MYTVYLIQSIANPDKKYIGYSANFEKRFFEHNSGKVKTTKNFVPMEVVVTINFKEEEKAKSFERYLKQGSGHAFSKKRFWN